MTRVLVIGKSGQVAQALAEKGNENVYCAGRNEADLLDPDSLARIINRHEPDIILNAGAYTSVDGAETETELCRALNVDGPETLAKLCEQNAVRLIHLSTDCVFDGVKKDPYTVYDEPNPLSVYGQSKRNGEIVVQECAARSLIVRVSWIFSKFGNNFVRTMLRLALTREEVSVVDDQLGCPTHAPDLAEALLQIAEIAAQPEFQAWGTYHLAGRGETDRASMARAIFEASARNGGSVAAVLPVSTQAYPTPARRPLNARLDMTDTTRVFGVCLPDWKEGLDLTVPVLVRELEG